MTIGLIKSEKLDFDSLDNILNFNGEIAAVKHQDDRKSNIVEKKLFINTIHN